MNSPYLYHPQPSSKRAADAVLSHIATNPRWNELFSQGKMLGVLIVAPQDNSSLFEPSPKGSSSCQEHKNALSNSCEDLTPNSSLLTPHSSLLTPNSSLHIINNTCTYICAYSGVINGLEDPEHFFVPPIYNLQNPEDFYLQKDAEITAINHEIKALEILASGVTSETQTNVSIAEDRKHTIELLKQRRKDLSINLQQEIFEHFSFTNIQGKYKNIKQIFSEAKRGLPPGGSGECAAPRLLQYAYQHYLQPLALAEFWYGRSPKNVLRVHGQFYPSCIEKCSPILRYMTEGIDAGQAPAAEEPHPIGDLKILYEDEHLLAVEKPAGVLSVPGKVAGESIETRLHELYPMVKGPMLVHRLDQATSGILLAAKNAQIHKLLQQDFETRAIHKEYLAVLDGKLSSKCGIIDLPICPNPDDRPRQIVDFLFGKKAVTGFYSEELGVRSEELSSLTEHDNIQQANNSYLLTPHSSLLTPHSSLKCTLVRFTPFTGRTHQLRLHAASPFGLGHPIVGDTIYGGTAHKRLMLHAYLLTFKHPVTGEEICLKSIPDDWQLPSDFGQTNCK